MANPVNATLLERLRTLDLPDWYLVAGCLFQSVWNGLTGNPPTYGISDYDVFYFDASDLSFEAEDAVIRRAAAAFADLDAEVQVRNQARVHLWYPEKYGLPIPPLTSSRDGIDGFLSQTSCFGVRIGRDGTPDVYAPFGFDDVFAMVVRPNRRRPVPAVYAAKAERWRRLWPALTILPWAG
ncbi:MAG: nucleotidyltransferase family protein [Candidatus Binatia bacterium]